MLFKGNETSLTATKSLITALCDCADTALRVDTEPFCVVRVQEKRECEWDSEIEKGERRGTPRSAFGERMPVMANELGYSVTASLTAGYWASTRIRLRLAKELQHSQKRIALPQKATLHHLKCSLYLFTLLPPALLSLRLASHVFCLWPEIQIHRKQTHRNTQCHRKQINSIALSFSHTMVRKKKKQWTTVWENLSRVTNTCLIFIHLSS